MGFIIAAEHVAVTQKKVSAHFFLDTHTDAVIVDEVIIEIIILVIKISILVIFGLRILYLDLRLLLRLALAVGLSLMTSILLDWGKTIIQLKASDHAFDNILESEAIGILTRF